MNSREVLERIRSREAELRAVTLTYERVKAWAEASTPGHPKDCIGASHTKGAFKDRTGDGAAALEEIGEQINAKLCGISEELAVAYSLIEFVDDPIDRTILDLHYLSGFTWRVVAAHVYMSHAQVRRRARRALTEIDKKMSTHEHPVKGIIVL